MIKTIIIEDEKPARDRLTGFIKDSPELELIASCENGKDAVNVINTLHPDLIFLDVHLPDISGLDVLKVISSQPLIIFTTAFDTYALDAFKNNAVDFLLKPFSKEQYREAVAKASEKINSSIPAHTNFEELLHIIRPQNEHLTRIPAKVGEKIYILPVNEIYYFLSKDKVVFAYLKNTSFIINFTLDELQNRLNNEHFIRIHRSTIVNFNFVHTIEPLGAGTYMIRMRDQDKTELQISRSAAKEIREKMGW